MKPYLRVLLTCGVAMALVATATPASACSCAAGDPRDRLAQADAAFIGTLLARRLGPDPGQATYTFRIDEDVKGTFEETEEVVSSDNGASCGLEIGIGQQTGLFVSPRDDGLWNSSLCQQINAQELHDAAQPFPAPDGQGPIKMLVGGSWGEMGIVALDSEGRTLAYGERVESSSWLSMCPGSQRFIETYLTQPERRTVVAVRDTSTLDVVREVELPIGVRPYRGLDPGWTACRDAEGEELIVTGVRYRESITGFMFRVQGDQVEKIYEGSSRSFSFDGDQVYLAEGRRGRMLRVMNLDTLQKRFVARYPGGVVDVSPDGTRLVATGRGAKLSVVDMSVSPATVRELKLSPYYSGDAHWIDDGTFAYLPGGYDNNKARIYTARLRLSDTLDGFWYALDNDVVDGVAYGLGWGTVFKAEVPGGPAEVIREIPSPELYHLVVVEDDVFAQP